MMDGIYTSKEMAPIPITKHQKVITLKRKVPLFACCLCKMTIYKAIHFEDERWLDKMSYAAADDQLFYYKMHLMGNNVIMYRNSGIIHLDAQAGHRSKRKNKMFLQKKNLFIMWYRTIYNIRSKNTFERFDALLHLLGAVSLVF